MIKMSFVHNSSSSAAHHQLALASADNLVLEKLDFSYLVVVK